MASMSSKHHEFAPSSFPAWSKCPQFDSDPAEREDAAEGTRQHFALSSTLSGDDAALAALSLDAREAVTWAAGYIRALAGELPITVEQKVSYVAPDSFAPSGVSEVFHGTADAIVIHPPGNLADLVDYKGGNNERDHRPQLAGYALALLSMRTRLKTIRCHVLYGRGRQVDSWSLSQADAAATVLPILEARQKPNRSATPCEYCPLCAHRLTCPALTAQVELVAKETNEWAELAPAIRDPASISSPIIASRALTLARFVSTWAEAVRARATELAKSGAVLPGYRLQERRGARELTDLDAAFTRSGLTPAQFLTACKLSISKLGEVFAGAHGLSKAQANREIESALADLIQEGPPSVCLTIDRKGES
jgi:hypothetical protein